MPSESNQPERMLSEARRAQSKQKSKGGIEGSVGSRAARRSAWTVYILLCRNGAYYVGVTNDMDRRWQEHVTGRGGRYTRSNPPVRIAYAERFPTRLAAETRERQLKRWTRRKKRALIAGDLALLKIL